MAIKWLHIWGQWRASTRTQTISEMETLLQDWLGSGSGVGDTCPHPFSFFKKLGLLISLGSTTHTGIILRKVQRVPTHNKWPPSPSKHLTNVYPHGCWTKWIVRFAFWWQRSSMEEGIRHLVNISDFLICREFCGFHIGKFLGIFFFSSSSPYAPVTPTHQPLTMWD